MEGYCYLRNIQDFEKRLNEQLGGPTLLFGVTLLYTPISQKDKSRLHQHGHTMLAGMCTSHWKFLLQDSNPEKYKSTFVKVHSDARVYTERPASPAMQCITSQLATKRRKRDETLRV